MLILADERNLTLFLSLSNNKGVIFYSEVVFDVFLARGIDIIYIPRPKKILNGTTYMLRPGRYTRECIRDKRYKKKKEKEYVSLIESDLPLFSLSFHQIYILYYTQLHVRAQIDSIRILYGATFISG